MKSAIRVTCLAVFVTALGSAAMGDIPITWGSNLHGESEVPAGTDHIIAVAAGGYWNLALRTAMAMVSDH